MSTFAGNTTPLLSVTEFLLRADKRSVARWVSDTGAPVAAADLATDLVLLAHIRDAEGEVESACLVKGLYTAADLAGLSGRSQGKLFRLITRIAVCLLYERRPGFAESDQPPFFYQQAMEDLEKLSRGERIFSYQEHADAGVMDHVTDTEQLVEQRNGIVVSARRFFGVRNNQRHG